MPRRPKPELEAERRRAEAASELERLVEPGKKKPKRRAPSPSYVRRVVADVRERITSDDWAGAKPRHLVGLYVVLHAWCYEVEAVEVVGTSWDAAVSAAKKLVRNEFGGEVRRAVEFVRWVWSREKDRERQRRESGREAGRIGWHLQFCHRGLLTDYRIDLKRREERCELGAGRRRGRSR